MREWPKQIMTEGPYQRLKTKMREEPKHWLKTENERMKKEWQRKRDWEQRMREGINEENERMRMT